MPGIPELGCAFANTNADLLVNEGETLFYGVLLLVSTTGGDVTLYEGLDAYSGRKIGRFEGIADQSTPVIFSMPIYLERGLFIAVGSNVTEVTVFYQPTRLD